MPPRRPQKRVPSMQGPGRRMPAQARGMPQASRAAELALQRRRQQMQRMQAMKAKTGGKGGMQRQAYEQQRKSWLGVWVFGPIVEFFKRILYPSEHARAADRIQHRQKIIQFGARGRNKRLLERQSANNQQEQRRRA